MRQVVITKNCDTINIDTVSVDNIVVFRNGKCVNRLFSIRGGLYWIDVATHGNSYGPNVPFKSVKDAVTYVISHNKAVYVLEDKKELAEFILESC